MSTATANLTPAIFLDRDGVINENRADYVKEWSEFCFLPGVFPALRRLTQLPHKIVIITNQSPIGRGIITLQTLDSIHERMSATIHKEGGRIDAIYHCPHRPDEGCPCRKPQPGMLLDASNALGLDLARSYLVGDAASDMQAGLAAGCVPIMVLTGRGREQQRLMGDLGYDRVPVVPNLAAAVDGILG